MKLTDKAKEILDANKQKKVDELKQNIRREDKVATGNLLNSVVGSTVTRDTRAILELQAADYAESIDEGREPGYQADFDELKTWAKAVIDSDINDIEVAFIQASLKEEGTPSAPILDVPVDDLRQELANGLAQFIGVQLTREIQNNLKK